MTRDELLGLATDPDKTPFDYVIVGSGAGGGPLAARLALNHQRVLVLEAGIDPGDFVPPRPLKPDGSEDLREVYAVPGYHAAATEDPPISWDFSVRHYENDAQQAEDQKYAASEDPSTTGGKGKGGIQYPRAAAVGGCTSHHAMIIIRPNDRDWDRLAEYTNDSSWRSENMQGYFAKIENCLYYAVYRGYLGRILGSILWVIQWIATQLNPKRQLDPGGHGSAGWQKTSFIDPLVIAGIVKTDRTFLGILKDVLFSALRMKDERSMLVRAFSDLQILQFLDPNVRSPEIPTRDHLSLISIGTDGKRRMGVREHLNDVKAKHPDRLVIETGVHATRVIFADDKAATTPRAMGVEVMEGKYLYRASPRTAESVAVPPSKQYFARREVILCGGSFNTPQMLMLSGIGDPAHLSEHCIKGLRDRNNQVIAPPVRLPGVGMNLQDRYEVSVISEAKREFSTLKDLTFTPDDANDPARKRWLENGKGLYATNGGALAMMMSSEANKLVRPDPDLFIFGVPAAFRGYYWGWSRQLLSRVKDAPPVSRNLWTWVILKAYTRNNAGTVRLRTNDPRDPPEINFHSFLEGSPGHTQDVKALCEAVQKVRAINGTIGALKNEIQPGAGIATGSAELEKWVQDEAWGHHACGTCRIGPDPWQANVAELTDPKAVIDSKFRVHGVRNLRVVDASIFPEIPGYFIVTPIFMIAEKAADTLLADSEKYPSELERLEAAAISARRVVAHTGAPPAEALAKLPDDTVGLALSGGGIRSATFCLGILQSLATRDLLRRFDYVASVSGGGYVASFLGRLYMRLSATVQNKAQHVREVLSHVDSPEIWWLRRHANYIASAGHEDLTTNLAVFSRNLVFVHLCVGALIFGIFGIARLLAIAFVDANPPIWKLAGFPVSFWWWVPWAILFVAVLPLAVGFWLVPIPRRGSPYSLLVLLTWLAVLVSGIYALGVPELRPLGAIIVLVLSLGWLVQMIARWGIPPAPKPAAKIAWATKEDQESDEPPVTPICLTVRNRLTRGLGATLLALAASIAWVVLDTFAQRASEPMMIPYTSSAMVVLALLLPFLRRSATGMAANAPRDAAAGAGQWKWQAFIRAGAIGLAGVLLFFIDVLVRLAFHEHAIGVWAVVTVLAASALIGRAFPFLNLSSLQQAYSEKLVRTFLGASTPTRVHPTGTNTPTPVEVPDPDDDVVLGDYHPERNGGPLHLISVCVNDTVDLVSGRQLRADKGLPMCLGPSGVSVGLRYHARWVSPLEDGKGPPAVSRIEIAPLPVAPDSNRFHVFVRKDNKPTWVEQLRLGQWMAISGASFTTGAGRNTNVAQSLLLGLLNVRLGYWWDSGIGASQRPGRYPPNIWRWLKSFPADVLFRVQATLLNEWRAYFPGPSARLWYLSDGGHFDNTALYELLRRRIPFIVAIDSAQDQRYEFEDLAILTRQVRLDFGATFTWIDPTVARQGGATAWRAINAAAHATAPSGPTVPAWIQAYFDPDRVGPLADLRREGGSCAAFARVTYADAPEKETWLLLVKSSLAVEVPPDVRNYAATHPNFPNEPTIDQFFDDAQWESYRKLGQSMGDAVFR